MLSSAFPRSLLPLNALLVSVILITPMRRSPIELVPKISVAHYANRTQRVATYEGSNILTARPSTAAMKIRRSHAVLKSSVMRPPKRAPRNMKTPTSHRGPFLQCQTAARRCQGRREKRAPTPSG